MHVNVRHLSSLEPGVGYTLAQSLGSIPQLPAHELTIHNHSQSFIVIGVSLRIENKQQKNLKMKHIAFFV